MISIINGLEITKKRPRDIGSLVFKLEIYLHMQSAQLELVVLLLSECVSEFCFHAFILAY